jgi:A118 family predicted phage portal protein
MALKGSPTITEDGNITSVLYFDKNDDTYVAINGMQDQPVKEIDFTLRVNEHTEAINSELNWLSAGVGFGESYYSLEGSRVKTATEVMSEDSDAYRTKNADEIVLKDVIYDLVSSICFLAGIQFENIEIITDYSRFKNETAEQQRYEREVGAGLISKVEYRMKVYGEDEEVARQKIEEIKANEPTIKDLLGE